MRVFLRLFVRRPVFTMALILAAMILCGLYPGSQDEKNSRISGADARRLSASGTVVSRECTSNGYRLIIDHLTFSFKDNEAPDAGRSMLHDLNCALSPGDRMQIFLSDGTSSEESLYGETDTSGDVSFRADGALSEDQTRIFESVRTGDRIVMYGRCAVPEHASNPGQFDSFRYYRARRIVLKMNKAELCSIERPDYAWPLNLILRYADAVADIRIGMQRSLISVFENDAGLMAAFMLGDGSGPEPMDKQLFRDGGLSWLLCVSSLHISLIGMLVYRLLKSRGMSFLLSGVCSMCTVGSYALMTGFSISAQRALAAFLIWTGAQILGRTRDTLSTLSASAVFVLLRQPYALWDCSFIMSGCCILSLEYLTPAIVRLVRPKRSSGRKLCASFSLWLGSLPAVLWFFYQTSPSASILYPVMLPLLGMLMCFGLSGCFFAWLFSLTGTGFVLALGRCLAWPCSVMLSALRCLCTLEQELPFSVLILGRPSVWQMYVYYSALTVFVLYIRKSAPRRFNGVRPYGRLCTQLFRTRIISVSVLSFLVILISLRTRPDFRFTCLDIGQGSCALIEHKDCVYLFDAGSSSVNDVWKYRISSTLKYYGIRRIDAVFLSHADMDHINGMEQMLFAYHRNLAGRNASDVTVSRILMPLMPSRDERMAAITQCAEKNKIDIGYVKAGECYNQDGMELKILSPAPDRITGNANEDCIVMLLEYRGLRILFTGDLEKEGEEMFVKAWEHTMLFHEEDDNAGKDKSSGFGGEDGMMLLIAGHHGSKYATSERFLKMVRPDLVFISCGKNNRYGHPAAAMLRRLEDAGVPCRRTDLEGAVQVKMW